MFRVVVADTKKRIPSWLIDQCGPVLRNLFFNSQAQSVLSSILVLFLRSLVFLNVMGCDYLKYEVTPTNEASSASTVSTPCVANAVTTEPCAVAAPGWGVSDTVGTTVTAWSNLSGGPTVDASIPTGYYENQSVAFDEPNLLAANILNGVSIFGVTGSATAAYAPCTDEALNAGQCSTSANRYVYTAANGGRSANCAAGFNGSACWTNATDQYVTGSLGGNITIWSNTTSSTTVDGTISLGYYPGNTHCVH